MPPLEKILAAGAAAQNIFLAARALGLGAMRRTGSNACDSELKRALRMEPEGVVIGFLYIGTPAKVPVKRDEEDAAGFVRELAAA